MKAHLFAHFHTCHLAQKTHDICSMYCKNSRTMVTITYVWPWSQHFFKIKKYVLNSHAKYIFCRIMYVKLILIHFNTFGHMDTLNTFVSQIDIWIHSDTLGYSHSTLQMLMLIQENCKIWDFSGVIFKHCGDLKRWPNRKKKLVLPFGKAV